jgi:sulfite exporter TauE/SafE
MVYAVLSTALVSGSWRQGALLMLVFGLGTLPNLMLLGLSGQWLARASRNRVVRLVAGSLIILFGLLGFMHLGMMVSAARTPFG